MKISEQLTTWYLKNKRDLPWRNTHDPYKIWLSEIILQQTRIEQGLSYYHTFVGKYPKVEDLANAELDAVLKDWEGLGYYSRARNLHFTANHIMDNLGGVFPNSYAELIQLKGIGTYTASAISSFSSNETKAVVDGNVYRFLGRLYDIEEPIDSSPGKKLFQQIADEIISEKNSGTHNQAIMEFGATQCTKHQPNCENCVFLKNCEAFKNKTVHLRPNKKKKLKVVNRFFNFYFINNDQGFLIQQRNEKGIWHKLYQFPLHESKDINEFNSHKPTFDGIDPKNIVHIQAEKPITHLLSHQKLHIRFWQIEVNSIKSNGDYTLSSSADVATKAFPKPIQLFLQEQLKPKIEIK